MPGKVVQDRLPALALLLGAALCVSSASKVSRTVTASPAGMNSTRTVRVSPMAYSIRRCGSMGV